MAMTSDYDALLSLFDAALQAERAANDAAEPWEEAAYRVAKASKGLEGRGRIRFEKTRFRIECQGTGIHSDEVWWEDFPTELLMAEMQKSSEKDGSK